MIIHNLNKHVACFCYGAGKDALIEIRELPRGRQESTCLSSHELVILLKGRLDYTVHGYDPSRLVEGNFTFVPIGRTVSYETKTNCSLLIIRQRSGLRLCHTFSIEQLYNGMENVSGKITPLEINPRLHHYVEGLRNTYEDGITCRYFFEAKVTELFVLLRAYYSDEQLTGLFLPMLSPDTEFSEFVRENHQKYNTINEMAAAMCLTTTQFANRFRRVFSQPPREWLQQEKARQIFTEICDSHSPLKQISDDYGFAVQSHLNRFCKRMFGMTPGEIRERKFERNKNRVNKY